MFKVGDRVRQTRHFMGTNAGTLGTIKKPCCAHRTCVDFDDGTKLHLDMDDETYASLIELVAPAEPAPARPGIYDVAQQMAAARANQQQQAQRQAHWTQTAQEPKQHPEAVALGELKDAISKHILPGEGYVACFQRILCELGDVRGERDWLRNRVGELETALAFAEREVARLSKRGGR